MGVEKYVLTQSRANKVRVYLVYNCQVECKNSEYLFQTGPQVLSRAFRNRFVELHFDELPSGELETILHQRCSLPPSYCSKLVKVMQDLQVAHYHCSANAVQHACKCSLTAYMKQVSPSSLYAGDPLCLRESMVSSPSEICSAGQSATGWRSRHTLLMTGYSI